MPKTKKIDVITVKLTCHIPHLLGDIVSLHDVTDAIEGLRRYATKLGETMVDTRLNRVTAPEPAPQAAEPVDDELNLPANLVRTVETEPTATVLRHDSPAF